MVKNLKRWLVKKLGGYYLDDEERNLLFPLWLKRTQVALEKTLDKNAAKILFNGFKTSDDKKI